MSNTYNEFIERVLVSEQEIKEKAKATHIARYYKVKKCKIRIGDKRVDGYEIISEIK